MRRWRVEFVDWHGNRQTIRLCFTKWGAERVCTRLSGQLSSAAVYLRVDADPVW